MSRFRLPLTLAAAMTAATPALADEITVFVAASLTDVAAAQAEVFEAETGHAVTLVPGSSSTLARQIESGAPSDLFISANLEWVEHAAETAGYGEPVAVLANSLSIVSRDLYEAPVTLEALPEEVGDGRLAVGDPEHVPAGIYAREAMENAGVWEALADRLAPAADVRDALRLVEVGAAPLGIVYTTDAIGTDVNIVGAVDPALHEPVTYYAALPPDSVAAAEAFLDFVLGDEGQRIAEEFGFARALSE